MRCHHVQHTFVRPAGAQLGGDRHTGRTSHRRSSSAAAAAGSCNGRAAKPRNRLEQLFATETFDPGTAAQSFHLAVSDYTMSALGPELVRTILTQSPNSTVSCEPLDDHIVEKLDAGTIDLLIYGRAAPDRYRGQHLFTDRFVCVVAAEHPPRAAQNGVAVPAVAASERRPRPAGDRPGTRGA
jgi:DNA-binding transcriptional LysR family regulator